MTAVQEERGPRRSRDRSHEDGIPKQNPLIEAREPIQVQVHPLPGLIDADTQVSIHPPASSEGQKEGSVILLASIRRASTNDVLLLLPPAQRPAIIEAAWAELFLLTASHWPSDLWLSTTQVRGAAGDGTVTSNSNLLP